MSKFQLLHFQGKFESLKRTVQLVRVIRSFNNESATGRVRKQIQPIVAVTDIPNLRFLLP